MRYNVMLRAVKSDRLRDQEVIGWANELPIIGDQFTMIGPPKDVENGDLRYIQTSRVVSVSEILDEDGVLIGTSFQTKSGSSYEVKVLLIDL